MTTTAPDYTGGSAEINGNIAAAAIDEIDAWHALGYHGPMSDDPASEDYYLDRAGLSGWDLTKMPLQVQVGSETVYTPHGVDTKPTIVEVPNKYAVVRKGIDNKVLGVVGPQYRVFTNEDLGDVARLHAGIGHLYPQAAGAVLDSRWVYLTFKVDTEWLLTDDPHIPYLVFVTSHDGSLPLTAVATVTRLSCSNQLRMMLNPKGYGIGKDGGRYTIQHRSQMQRRVEDAARVFNRAVGYFDAYQREADRLMHTTLTTRGFDLLLDGLFPTVDHDGNRKADRAVTFAKKARNQVRSLYTADERVGKFTGTAWGALQAVNTYETWVAPVKAKGRPESTVRAERLVTSLVQTSQPLSQQARAMLPSLIGR